MDDPKLDSKEGIEALLKWARAHVIVLSERHRRLADKYGVDTAGVIFSEPMPAK